MKNRWLSRLAALCLLTSLGWGAPLFAEQADMATAVVRDTTGRMLQVMRERRAELEQSPELIFNLVDQIVIPNFDFQRITRYALGKYWHSATEAQQKALVEEFQQMLVRTYAKALLTYSGQEIQFLPLRPGKRSGHVTVRTEVQEPGALPVPINYQMYLNGADWKVYDVNIDGVSLVANYRSSFAAQVRRNGIDGLIETLRARNGESGA